MSFRDAIQSMQAAHQAIGETLSELGELPKTDGKMPSTPHVWPHVWPHLSEQMHTKYGELARVEASILFNAWQSGCSGKHFRGEKLIKDNPQGFLIKLIESNQRFSPGNQLSYFMKLIMVYNQWRPKLLPTEFRKVEDES